MPQKVCLYFTVVLVEMLAVLLLDYIYTRGLVRRVNTLTPAAKLSQQFL